MATKPMGKWIDDLINATEKYVNLELGDGIIRQGRLSGHRARTLMVNGHEVLILTELELNGDVNDTVPLDRITKIRIT